MYISEITLSNFRGFEQNTIFFQDGMNVLIGQNNSGKTSVIKALGLLFDSEKNKRLKVEDFFKSKELSNMKLVPPKITISAKLLESENEDIYSDDLALIGTWLTKLEKPYEAQITYEFFLPDKETEDYVKKINDITNMDIEMFWNIFEYNFINKYIYKIYIGNPEYKIIVDYDILKKFDFQFLSAIRDVERDMFTGKNPLLREVIDFFIDYDIKNEKTIDKSEKENQIKKRKKEFSDDAEVLIAKLKERMKLGKEEMLKYATATGATGNHLNPDFDGKILDTEMYSTLKLIVEDKSGIKLPATRNGLGYNNLIYMSLLLAKMQKNSSIEYLGANSKIYSILAIEEPEAHLHPNMQYKFLKFLNEHKNNDVRQIFITSHSPNITAAVDLDDIIILSKNISKVIVSYPGRVFDNTIEEDKKSKKYVQRFLDVTKSDMFFSENLIFVEGLAEQLLIPVFSKRLKYNLIDSYTSVINLSGRYFDHFLKLFDETREFSIPKNIACITDRDPQRKEKIKGKKYKVCLPIFLDVDNKKYEYKKTSNKLIGKYNSNRIKIFTQDEGSGCTLEYQIIFENYKNKDLFNNINFSNKDKILEFMSYIDKIIEEDISKEESSQEIFKFLNAGSYKDEIKLIYDKITLSSENNAKHILAGLFLNSIDSKGEMSQELASLLEDENIEFNVPIYIKGMIEWMKLLKK